MSNLNIYDVIRRPIITEKTTMQSELGKYGFIVAKNATKSVVKAAIQKIFDVQVDSVHIINCKGKVKRFRGNLGKQNDLKKAIVTLASGHQIDLTGGVK
jgi:large subunit ribosomal protein L23